MTPMDEIKNLIQSNLPESLVEVSDMTGTQDHLEILVVSDVFEGKMRLAQHQIVMDILNESLKEKVHAVKIKTLTKAKYEEVK